MEERSHFVYCDNQHRTAGDDSQFEFSMADCQIRCEEDESITVELFDFFAQNSHGNGTINNTNNSFVLNSTLIRITPGYYTPVTLATRLTSNINTQLALRERYISGAKTDIDALSGKITVTYDKDLKKLNLRLTGRVLLGILFTRCIYFFIMLIGTFTPLHKRWGILGISMNSMGIAQHYLGLRRNLLTETHF
jgi:hypothetical protein